MGQAPPEGGPADEHLASVLQRNVLLLSVLDQNPNDVPDWEPSFWAVIFKLPTLVFPQLYHESKLNLTILFALCSPYFLHGVLNVHHSWSLFYNFSLKANCQINKQVSLFSLSFYINLYLPKKCIV